jgi:hypothetical protein
VDSVGGCLKQSSHVTTPGGTGGWRISLDLGLLLLLVPHSGDHGSALLESSGDPTERAATRAAITGATCG